MSEEKDQFERIRKQLPTPEEIIERVGDELLEAEFKLKYGGRPGKGLYVLEGHTPVPIDDVLEWARRYEQSENRRVARTSINGWDVSTVFLGIDSNIFSEVPLLFETMIFSETEITKTELFGRKFRKSLDNYCKRYATWDEALAGHEAAVNYIREGLQ